MIRNTFFHSSSVFAQGRRQARGVTHTLKIGVIDAIVLFYYKAKSL